MSKQVAFNAIDFEAIEFRNVYRHTKAVFAFVAALAWMWAPLPTSLSEEGLVFWLLVGGLYLCLLTPALAALYIQYKSRVVITGQSIILKRPLLKDVEITYSEIGEVQVNGMVIREGYDRLKLRSRDKKKKIIVEQSLENFDRFCDDLNERWRLAIERYQGYAKGISARQFEHCMKTLETLKAQREEKAI